MSREVGKQDLVFMWENQPWGVPNTDKSGETKEKTTTEPPKTSSSDKQKEEKTEGDGDLFELDKKRGPVGANRTGKKIGNGDGKDLKVGESDHDIHIWTERERRKKMRNMFSSLHELLPHIPSKADKSTIVDEAVNYIKSQQLKLQHLQKLKQERLRSMSSFGYDQSVLNSQWHPYNSRELPLITDQGSTSMNMAGAITNPNPSSFVVPQHPVVFETYASPNVVLNVCGDDATFSVCSPKKKGLFANICFVLEKYQIEVSSAHVSSYANRRMYMIQAHAHKASNQFSEGISAEEIFRQAAREINFALAL